MPLEFLSINKNILNQDFTYVYNVITTRNHHNQMLLYISLRIKNLQDVNTYEIWYHVIHEHQNWLRGTIFSMCYIACLENFGAKAVPQSTKGSRKKLFPYFPSLNKLSPEPNETGLTTISRKFCLLLRNSTWHAQVQQFLHSQ